MSLNIFSAKVSHHKNGIWWFTKMMARAVGEDRWEAMRLFRRVQANKFYYARQQFLFEIFYDWPEMANMIGIYPKGDASHGFPHVAGYEMYRDWQENTLNSDGSFAMWVYLVGGIYLIHSSYSYMIPYYWTNHFPAKNEEIVRLRMKDALASTVYEESFGNQFSEFGWTPHAFHYNRMRCMTGYAHPDDPRTINMGTFNRKNKYKEHYMKRVGDQNSMTFPR